MSNFPRDEIQPSFQNIHYFLWKNNRFPFCLKIFNCFTDYFLINQDQIKPDKTIDIIENQNIKYSEESIQTFINYCQNQKISITNDNALSLYYLSKIYDIKDLNEKVNRHILSHQKENVLQILLMDNNYEQKIQCEETISQNFAEYIKIEQFYSLPINVLHRIISKVQNIDQETIESFLIVCLTKIGKDASVLFDTIDVKKASSGFINKLLIDFSDIFDFHFINPLFLKSIYIQQNELIKQTKIMKKKQDEKLQQISDENRLISEKVDLMYIEIENLKRTIAEKNEEISQIKNSPPYQFFKYSGNENESFNGIINYLTKICGGNVHEKGIINIRESSFYDHNFYDSLKYIVDFNEKTHFFSSKKGKKEWIEFNFIGHKVRPTHYSIRSRPNFDYNHPKSWVIEGSKTGGENDWMVLDQRNDEEWLVGLNKQHTFDIKNVNDDFQYLRIRLIKDSNNDEYLNFAKLEFFGYLY